MSAVAALLTPAEIARLRVRRDDPAFAPAWVGLRDRADEALAAGLRPVDQGAGWGHAYYCPDHVVLLEFDPAQPHRHRCPEGGEVRRGDAFDAGWRTVLNARILGGLGACSLVWRATGDLRYRDHAVDLLGTYARMYPDLPPNGEHVGKGRVTGQSLEEAVWAVGVAHAYDGVRDALEPADRSRIEADLLQGLATHLRGQLLHKIHNIECWHLAALATLGVVLDDDALVSATLTGDHGLTAQLREGILDDGWWAEGSPSYHFYMLQSILWAGVALRHRAPDFLATPRLRTMFSTPLTMLRSDLSLPALNDGWLAIALPLGVAGYAGLYEEAYGLWQDDADADFLRELYARGVPRSAAAALTMGPDLRRLPGPLPTPRRVHPSSGYAVVADGSGSDERFLLLKYGPHGGGHGHPDKLQLDLHAYGVRLAPDAGSPAYNSPLQGPWFRQTLSHSTVLLAEESQPEAEGRLLAYLPWDEAAETAGAADTAGAARSTSMMDAAVSWPVDPDGDHGRQGAWLREPRRVHVPAYAGATARRCVLWKPAPHGYFVDLVLVGASGTDRVDLAWHHRGRLAESGPATLADVDWSPAAGPYEFLDDVRALAPTAAGWFARWEVEGAGTRMWGLDPDDTETLVATVPSNPPVERQAMLLRRAHGPRTCFAAVVEPVAGTTGSVRAVRWHGNDLARGGSLTLEVDHAAGTDRWRVSMTTGAPSIERTIAADGATVFGCELSAVPPWDGSPTRSGTRSSPG